MTGTSHSTATGEKLTSEEIGSISTPFGLLGAALDHAQTHLFTAGMDGQIEQIDLQSQERTLIGKHESYASNIIQHPDPGLVVSSGYDGLIIWHDLRQRRPVQVVEAHRFWSWSLALSPNGRSLASVTGQYQSGGYRYEPASETEPSLKIFDADSGVATHELSHIPPVTALAFSPDSRYVAAGNLMGEIRIYDLKSSRQVAQWTTPDFTSWGIIKSHHYIGGIFDLFFTADGEDLVACGMGPMRDPMAGNGVQTWQRFRWRTAQTEPIAAIDPDSTGKGLMETLALDSPRDRFVMAGRLAQGQWNTGIFDLPSGRLLHSIDTKMRTTKALFTKDGNQLILCGAKSQKGPKDGVWPDFGQVLRFRLDSSSPGA